MIFLTFVMLIAWCYSGDAFLKIANLEPVNKNDGDTTPKVNQSSTLVFQNKCIEDIGCFYTGPPFYDPVYRPKSAAPVSNIGVHFLLFTPSDPVDGEEIDTSVESIRGSSFDHESPLKVLIHGYTVQLKRNNDLFDIKDAFLNINKYNVIIVNWTESDGPPYAQAIANGRAVGAKIAKLLKVIMKTTELKAQNIHIIGHSLGAHISGWAGERIPNLGRITGLDPAGPYFHNADRRVRLDIMDAQFVDVIHTNAGERLNDSLGLYESIGHMDFYPNGGRLQPGCESENNNTGIMNSTKVFPDSCSHARAKSYFLESIDNSNCRTLATLCSSYRDFEKHECLTENSNVAEMGFHAKKVQGVPIMSKFFLKTRSEKPFCIENSI